MAYRSYKPTNFHFPIEDALKGVGVERPALLAQYVSVGGSALVGYVLARKSKSIHNCINFNVFFL